MQAHNCNQSFELSLAETVLHHAAQNATKVFAEMVRVSSRFVLVSEDILEDTASEDVLRAFVRHDRRAV